MPRSIRLYERKRGRRERGENGISDSPRRPVAPSPIHFGQRHQQLLQLFRQPLHPVDDSVVVAAEDLGQIVIGVWVEASETAS